jgi:hypothetical protein
MPVSFERDDAGIANLAIDVDPQAGTSAAEYQRAASRFRIGDKLVGRFAVSAGHIAIAVVVTSEFAP